MTSTTSQSPGLAASNPPTFSYAQAAKGRAPTASPSANSTPAASGVSTPKDSISMANASIGEAPGSSEGGDKLVNGSLDAVPVSDSLGGGGDSESKSSTLTGSGSLPASPSFGSASTATLPKEEEFTTVGGASHEGAWERRGSQQANGTDKSGDATDARRKKVKKSKNGDKDVEKEKPAEKEEEKKPENLIAAPPPSVNIWHQRKEAQSLKAKPSPTASLSPTAFPETTSTNEAASKSINSKPKSKSGSVEGEKVSSAGQAGAKEVASKGQKKSTDNIMKGKDDPTKRNGPRGSRSEEPAEKSAVSQLPPPVEDAISWPTPETALEEEKRKAQEKERTENHKEDRDESASNKPRAKEKWVAVPYVPSVNFNTPLPGRIGSRRTGTSRGNGREFTGRSGPAANTGEKANTGASAIASTVGEGEGRERGNSSATRATSVPPNSSKRSSNDGRSQGKPGAISGNDKSRNGSRVDANSHDIRTPNSAQTPSDYRRFDNFKGSRSEQGHGASESISRPGAPDRKSDPNLAGDQGKDGANFKENGPNRSEGRGGRGGGFRGRGGHNGFPNGQNPQHGYGQQPSNGFPRQNSNPYSPPMQQIPFTNQYVPGPSRGRGSSRSQSIPNVMYGRYPGPPMPPLETSNPYAYQQPLQAMSAMPFSPYAQDNSVLQMVKMQLEYYFSIDNLCKDVFLRKHMDSQGFVLLTFIAGFKRIQALTQDLDMLRYACLSSPEVDLVTGDDKLDRLRRKEGYEQWVLNIEERDTTAQTAGPARFYSSDFHQRFQNPQAMDPARLQEPPMSPHAFPQGNGFDPRFSFYGNGAPAPMMNGNGVPAPMMNGNGSNHHHPETPLSAAGAVFEPAPQSVNGTSSIAGSNKTSDATDLEAETTFTDAEVANLTLVFSSKRPLASTRTFSNGSMNSEEMQEGSRKGRGLINGSHDSENAAETSQASRSSSKALSPTSTPHDNGPDVMWAKGQSHQAPILPDNSDELYSTVRARALENRKSSAPSVTHPDMKLLYDFWSHFLCRNFNPTMYLEFRKYALEDAQSSNMDGMRSLIIYYDETLNHKKKIISDTLADHYVELVQLEKSSNATLADRPAYGKLRTAWRNGALDLKSRRKIQVRLDEELKKELDG